MSENKELAAICGLWCGSCVAYIGTHEEPSRLEMLSKSTGQPVEKLQCNGCRSNRLTYYCESCKISACARGRGYEFCGDCNEFPCELVTGFHGSLPHRSEVIPSLCSIRDDGWEEWVTAMKKLFRCDDCGTINTAYDITCRHCGKDPSNGFVRRHKQQILAHFAARKVT